jgi:hypothetical protein
MKVGAAATSRSLAALLHEAVAAVGILRDDDEGAVLEARLALERWADQVVVLVLGWNAPKRRAPMRRATRSPGPGKSFQASFVIKIRVFRTSSPLSRCL